MGKILAVTFGVEYEGDALWWLDSDEVWVKREAEEVVGGEEA